MLNAIQKPIYRTCAVFLCKNVALLAYIKKKYIYQIYKSEDSDENLLVKYKDNMNTTLVLSRLSYGRFYRIRVEIYRHTWVRERQTLSINAYKNI